MAQFASLNQLLDEWRADGYTAEDVELWAVGYYTTIGQASTFGEGFDAACLADVAPGDGSAYSAYDAYIDDVFIVDRQGQVRYRFTVGRMSMTKAANRDTVDGWARELLGEI